MAKAKKMINLARFVTCFVLVSSGFCQTICSNPHQRALVMSGGGAKGAFEAGAAYHFIVHRGCDFDDLAGVSVGALNTAYLAQAERDLDPATSLWNMQRSAEGLVGIWEGIRGPDDVLRPRHFAKLRWALFGLESLNDFTPLQRLIEKNIKPELLRKGRIVRVGSVGYFDGGYVEILASDLLAQNQGEKFLQFVYASSAIPVYSEMPRIPMKNEADPSKWQQFGDGGVRQVIPVTSYFRMCHAVALQIQMTLRRPMTPQRPCIDNPSIPPHSWPIHELFVVVASPFHADDDHDRMAEDDNRLTEGTHQIGNGQDVLDRTMGLLVDSPYRWDINYMNFANEALAWRENQFARNNAQAPEFPVESYNSTGPQDRSKPYSITFVAPERVFADTYGFEPGNIREQLYCGCMAADRSISSSGANSMADKCEARFNSQRTIDYAKSCAEKVKGTAIQ